ncbi:hypothetical protein NUH87_00790 [Pseudomonas batumici]|uniref:hypothetical protein n=1 Tax=Pseudomonas batumici TaxID=226910 RepID=UPI0030D561F6
MKMEMTIYDALLATEVSEEIATAILDALDIKKSSVLAFEPGRMLVTRGVRKLEKEVQLNTLPYLMRHWVCDWGELEEEDKLANFQALRNGTRLFSTYRIDAGDETKLCICTAADRSYTLLLLPIEYGIVFPAKPD